MKSWKAELLLLFMTLVWGSTFFIIKSALDDTPPYFFVIVRLGCAFVLAAAIWWRELLRIDARDLRQGVLLGVLYGGGFILQTFGLTLTTASKSSFVTGSVVTMVPFAYWIIERKKVSRWQVLGVVIVTFGLWMFTQPDINNLNYGDIVTLFSAILWAFYIPLLDKYTYGDPDIASRSIRLVLMQIFTTGFMALIAHVLFEGGKFKANFSSGDFWFGVLYTAVMSSVVATFIQTRYQHYTTPVKAALIYSLEPIFATVLAVLFINEPIDGEKAWGGVIVILGVLIAELGGIFYERFLSRFVRP